MYLTANIAKMLLKKEKGEIKILPALPKSWKNGEVKGLRLTNNRTVLFKWENGTVSEKEIISF